MNHAPRQLVVLREPPEQARLIAAALLADVRYAWFGATAPPRVDRTPPHRARTWLGRTVDVAVVDLHGLGPTHLDALGVAHGLVRGGGWLVLIAPDAPDEPLARFLEPHLAHGNRVPPSLAPAAATAATRDQDAVLMALVGAVSEPATVGVVTAARGRGKSALGGRLAERLATPECPAIATGPNAAACAEVMRFAPDRVTYVPLHEVLDALLVARATPLLLVDEAAQLPVAALKRLAHFAAHTPVVFLTTTQGYEGTGRGFVLRFLPWLREQPSFTVSEHTLQTPIRWAADDPLEEWSTSALLLDAHVRPLREAVGANRICVRVVSPHELATDPGLTRDIFALLVTAHYRTRPSDLGHLLADNRMHLHVATHADEVVGVCWVAEEGGLSDAEARSVSDGERNLHGHALPDVIAAHLGHPEGATLRWVRSVRIATHPAARRCGVARTLVEHVHAAYGVDGFATLHGASLGVLRFRQSLGYAPVRVSASRGARTGEPSLAMLRPVTEPARRLVSELRAAWRRDAPVQLDLHERERALLLDDDLRDALLDDAGSDGPRPSVQTVARRLRRFAQGPATFESVASDVLPFLRLHAEQLDELPPDVAATARERLRPDATWRSCREAGRHPSHRAAVRSLRQAVRTLLETGSIED